MHNLKKRDGFEGEKLISLPDSVWKNAISTNSVLHQLYITHIGYFPKARYHYCERTNGCEDNILLYCLRGKGWYKVRNKRFEVNVNEYVIIPATTEYLQYGADEDDPWTIYWIHFSGVDMNQFNACFHIGLFDGPKQILLNEKGIDSWHTIYQRLQMGFSRDNLASANLSLYHLVSTFLYPGKPAGEKEQDAHERVDEAITYMQDHIDIVLTVQEMAEKTGLSASHFSSLFRKATGMSPMDYFIHLKLQKACLLLYSTGMKIKNVALAVGYEDPYHFSRLFKKSMHVSPEQYRALRRKDV